LEPGATMKGVGQQTRAWLFVTRIAPTLLVMLSLCITRLPARVLGPAPRRASHPAAVELTRHDRGRSMDIQRT
jgi:hypothetical protein